MTRRRAAHYRRALEALGLDPRPDEATRCELLLEMGGALACSGDRAEAGETFESAAASARRLGRAELLAHAALGFAGTWALSRVGFEPACVAVLEEALASVGDGEPVLRARLLTRLSEELYYSPERGRRAALSEEALGLVRRHGDSDAIAAALGARHTAVWGQRPVEQRLALAREMVQLGEEADDKEITFQGLAWTYADRLELTQAGEAAAALERVVGLAGELRQPAYRWWASMLQATHAEFTGQLDKAEARIEEAAFWGARADIRAAEMYAAGQLHYVRVDQGRAGEMVDTMRRLVEKFPAVPSLRCMLAEAYAESGLAEEARGEMRALSGDERALGMLNASWSIGRYSLSMACAKLGDATLAARLSAELLPHEARLHVAFRGAAGAGSVARTLGLLALTLGDAETAERHLLHAIEVNERVGAVPQLQRARCDYRRLLCGLGRQSDPVPPVTAG